MINIKYSYPHTFFLSVAVVLLIFGLYPFYITNFDFHVLTWTVIIVNGLSILISFYCFFVGFGLWNQREEQREETANIAKKRMIQEIELQELEIQERRSQFIIQNLNKEINSLKDSKEKARKNIEAEILNKTSELEKLKRESIKKQREIDEKAKKVYELQKDEVSKLPSRYLFNNLSVSGASLLGGPIFPSGAIVVSENSSAIPFSGSNFPENYALPRTLPLAENYVMTCKKCGKTYLSKSYISGEYFCNKCRN